MGPGKDTVRVIILDGEGVQTGAQNVAWTDAGNTLFVRGQNGVTTVTSDWAERVGQPEVKPKNVTQADFLTTDEQ